LFHPSHPDSYLHARNCIAIVIKAAVEDLALAIVGRTPTTSLDIDIAYDLEEKGYRNDKLFFESDSDLGEEESDLGEEESDLGEADSDQGAAASYQGRVMLPFVVPNQATFTNLTGRLDTIRGGQRPGCSIRVKIVGDIKGDCYREYDRFKLLEASYDAPVNSDPPTIPLGVEEARIKFHLDPAVHQKAMDRLVCYDEDDSWRSYCGDDSEDDSIM
jgi:hypothetical protein